MSREPLSREALQALLNMAAPKPGDRITQESVVGVEADRLFRMIRRARSEELLANVDVQHDFLRCADTTVVLLGLVGLGRVASRAELPMTLLSSLASSESHDVQRRTLRLLSRRNIRLTDTEMDQVLGVFRNSSAYLGVRWRAGVVLYRQTGGLIPLLKLCIGRELRWIRGK